MAMTNVAVSLNDSFAEICLSWEMNGFRYHIWSHDPAVLYKNPPLGVEYKKPGYFPTRKLDATVRANAQMINLARIYAREQRVADKTKAEMLAKKAEDDEARRIHYDARCKREAAEEMYEALKQLLEDSREFHDTPETEELLSGSHTDCGWCMAKAALAKAVPA